MCASRPTLDALLAALVMLTALPACDTLRELRLFFHPEEAEAYGRLRVEVEPAREITIDLDGELVAHRAPYLNDRIAAGAHRLSISAPGYHPVSLPIVVYKGQLLRVPVELRHRPEEAYDAPPAGQPPPPPEPPAPALPAGVVPIALLFSTQPPAPVALDGVTVTSSEIRLERVYGTLAVAGWSITYRLGGAGTLALGLPDDGAQWLQDGVPLRSDATLHFDRGAMRLERLALDATRQTLVLRRK